MIKTTPETTRVKRTAKTAIRLALGMLFLAAATGRVEAQSSLRIAATVNDEMISLFDVESRMRLAMYLSKLPNTDKIKNRLARQILRAIIDDKLKMQESKRAGVEVTVKEIQTALAEWEKRAGLSKGGSDHLARRLGIDKSAIIEQIETSVAWTKIIRDRFLPSSTVAAGEAEDILAEQEKNAGKPEFLVSEIFLPSAQSQGGENVTNLANRLIQQIQSGAKFSAVARNFSQSPTAAVGGSLGWNRASHFPTQLDKAIRSLQVGQVSQPIRTYDGVYILLLRQKRAIQPFLRVSSAPETVSLFQVHFELPEGAAADIAQNITGKARQVAGQARSCADMEALGKKVGSSLSGSLGMFKVDQLSPKLRSTISTLAVNTPSQPVATPGGLIVVMVCERNKPQARKITRHAALEEIQQRLLVERLNLAERQFLRSLRRAAVVDLRL